MDSIAVWFDQYGYWVLFFGLLFEYIGFPFPGELVMSYAGFLTYRGSLNWMVCVLLSAAGTMIGMTFAYCFGRLAGYPFFEKYGSRFLMGPEKWQKASRWFNRYGNLVVFFAYFIPGLRHLTGYFCGMLNTPFRTFALYAYGGAVFWVLTFLTLGNRLGPNWKYVHQMSHSPQVKILLAVLVGMALFWFGWKYRHILTHLAGQAFVRRGEHPWKDRHLRWLIPAAAVIGMAMVLTSFIATIRD